MQGRSVLVSHGLALDRHRLAYLLAVTLLFLILGHSFGTHYLKFWGQRQLVGGLYLAKLSPGDTYATIEFDEFCCYFPRAMTVSKGQSPLDAWAYHEASFAGWGPLPLFPPLVFGALAYLSGDLHLALYLASILSTVLQGSILVLFFLAEPLRMSYLGALIAALCFLKAPWFATNVVQLSDSGYGLRGLAGWVPYDGFLDVEAGLFTYFPYLAFLISFWRLMEDHRGQKRAVAAGILAGALTYVYFYHQSFAFLLLCSAAAIALAEREWDRAKRFILAVAIGVLCAVPHYIQLVILSGNMSLPEYLQRLGFETGRWDVQNLVYLRHLVLMLAAGALYARFRKADPTKALCLRVLIATVVAYVCVLNLRVILGFDMNSDHYWRHSLGLAATLWLIVLCADIMKELTANQKKARLATGALAAALVMSVPLAGLYRLWEFWNLDGYRVNFQSEQIRPSDLQGDMIKRMELLRPLLHSNDVFLAVDPATAYHALINYGVRLYVPYGLSIISNREILERFFVAQYLSGESHIRGPSGLGQPRSGTDFVHATGEQLFLFIDYTAPGKMNFQIDDELMELIHTVSIDKARVMSEANQWRIDVIFGKVGNQRSALERLSRHFLVPELREADGYWAARVMPRI